MILFLKATEARTRSPILINIAHIRAIRPTTPPPQVHASTWAANSTATPSKPSTNSSTRSRLSPGKANSYDNTPLQRL